MGCVLCVACCVLRGACCVSRVTCCVLRVAESGVQEAWLEDGGVLREIGIVHVAGSEGHFGVGLGKSAQARPVRSEHEADDPIGRDVVDEVHARVGNVEMPARPAFDRHAAQSG